MVRHLRSIDSFFFHFAVVVVVDVVPIRYIHESTFIYVCIHNLKLEIWPIPIVNECVS